MTEAARAEIIRQLQKLIEEIEESTSNPFILSRMSIARGLIRKLAGPRKADGDGA